MRVSSCISLLVLLCLSPVFAQEASDANKEKSAALMKEAREIAKKLAAKKEALDKDPDIQAANEVARVKLREAQDAREAVYLKIAEKNPVFKELLDSRNALKSKIEASKKKEDELNAVMEKAKAELAELKMVSGAAAKDYLTAEKDVLTKSRPHWKDADLKDLLESVKTADEASRDAVKVPEAKAREKDPEYKELVTRRSELYQEINTLRPKRTRTEDALKEPKTKQPRPKKIKKAE
ncbi:MAG: hypothetical protein O3B01_27565 [Planctomycetota bacterium]|nr:hypothetical protein [Planctomycetota bacterium]MDA1142339.1 hypothetical protein [Planctomycetota bacterium]